MRVVEEEEGIIKEHQALLEILRRKQRAPDDKKSVIENTPNSFMPSGNVATYAYSTKVTSNTHALASTPEWINDFGASRHVTGNASEFSSYTHLAMPKSIQIVDGTTQPVVGMGTMNCTDFVTLSNVLHAPFPINLLSISAIILQLKCVGSFDIPNVIGDRLETWDWLMA